MSSSKKHRFATAPNSSGLYRASSSPTGYAGNAKCQKCLQNGHWTFDCKNERIYKARPSRTAMLHNPELRPKVSTTVLEEERKAAASEVIKEILEKHEEGSESSSGESYSSSSYDSESDSSSSSRYSSTSSSPKSRKRRKSRSSSR